MKHQKSSSGESVRLAGLRPVLVYVRCFNLLPENSHKSNIQSQGTPIRLLFGCAI